MSYMDDLATFVAVVQAGSFTRAAARLGVSKSAISHAMRTLETRLGIKLLQRTTRSVSTTEAGQRLYLAVAPRFADIEQELSVLSELRDKPAGTVRITASDHAVDALIWPRLAHWLTQYPDISVEITSDNRFTDIVANRYDIGVRIGEDLAKDMIAVRMSPDLHMAVVGSPGYFQSRTRPRAPQDLLEHNCINLRLPTHGGLMPWEFKQQGQHIKINVRGQLVFSNMLMTLQAALDDGGLAWLPRDRVAPHLASGRLEMVLEDCAASFSGYHLYYASRQVSPAVALVLARLRSA
ncbi:LysR family transcriptional regulator [Paludibacterium sp. THUN1379]|uniref:LysR family transcriptional regulator n=1 Tax=Paludibacterium sp. THUN1379 TaxID=3112107 RepID=UPI0030916FE3|nr:LysR family transcriptional regulator [Paludibacterium sp. THUN1379]